MYTPRNRLIVRALLNGNGWSIVSRNLDISVHIVKKVFYFEMQCCVDDYMLTVLRVTDINKADLTSFHVNHTYIQHRLEELGFYRYVIPGNLQVNPRSMSNKARARYVLVELLLGGNYNSVGKHWETSANNAKIIFFRELYNVCSDSIETYSVLSDIQQHKYTILKRLEKHGWKVE